MPVLKFFSASDLTNLEAGITCVRVDKPVSASWREWNAAWKLARLFAEL